MSDVRLSETPAAAAANQPMHGQEEYGLRPEAPNFR